MGNSQGRSSPAPVVNVSHKSPRSGKYPVSQTKSLSGNENGSNKKIVNNGGSSRVGRSAPHQPRVEFDIPEFLQENQETKKYQSPVVQRHLRDPDPVILEQGSTSPKKGLLVPQPELQVPDFLSNTAQPNGKAPFLDGNVKSVQLSQQNGPTRVQRSKPLVTSRTPGNLRAVYATKDLNTSHEQINIESDSKRHESATQESVNLWAKASPPRARGTFVIENNPSTSQTLQSRSMTNLYEPKQTVQVDITPDLVDDFGTFSLQRKYKKRGERDKNKTNLTPEERLAPGVTGKHAVKQPRAVKNKSIEEERNRGAKTLNGNHWSLTDTDSVKSTSSLSFTDPTSQSNSSIQRNFNVNQKEHNFPRERTQFTGSNHPPKGYESPDSSVLGYFADSSLTCNQDSSIDEGRKISRKNSLQAHLRQRVKDYEKNKQENSRQHLHVHYDSDSTTISDQSVFGEGLSSVTRFSASGMHMVHINNLQDDLLLKIFSYLSTLELCKITGVCRKWQSLAWDPMLWNTIDITSYEDSDINRILRNLLTTLAMSTQGYCLMVHRIKLNGSELISDKGLGFIARFCIDLEELEICGCCCITNKGLQDILLNCHSLRHLNLSGCTCVNGICLPSSNGFSVGDHGSFLRLQYLDLSDCVAFDDFGLRTIGLSCGLLESLFLRRCSRITDVGMKHVVNHCHHLRELSTSDCFKIRDFSLKEIARNIPGLKYLSVAKCPVSDSGIKYIGRHCVRLKYLNVRGCESITDVGIAYVVQNCLKLRSLDIGKCDITDNVMNTIGIHCPQLKKLSMKSCGKVSDQGVKCIAAQCCNLQYLNVQECNVSFETFTFIREHCRNCIIEHTCPAFF